MRFALFTVPSNGRDQEHGRCISRRPPLPGGIATTLNDAFSGRSNNPSRVSNLVSRNHIIRKPHPPVQIGRTRPRRVASVLRTRMSTSSIPINGTIPAATMMRSNEWEAAIWGRSEKCPISLNAMMVPIPAPVPLMPLTVATDWLKKRSEGKTLAIVENEA